MRSSLLQSAQVHETAEPSENQLVAAAVHGVLPLLIHHRVWRASAKLTNALSLRAMETELQLRTQQRLLERLERAEIEVVVLKGPLLGERLYGEAQLRPSIDIDLLVAEADLRRALLVVRELGYQPVTDEPLASLRRRRHHVVLRHATLPVLELHFYAHVGFGTAVRAEPLLARRRRYDTNIGHAVMLLAPLDELVYLCAHGAAHRYERLLWLLDLAFYARLHPELRVPVVLRRAQELGVRKATLASLHATREHLGCEWPELPAPDLCTRLALRSVGLSLREPIKPLETASNTLVGALLCDSTPRAARKMAQKLLYDLPRRLQR